MCVCVPVCACVQVMETVGAIFLGGSVSSTISGGVADPKTFANYPELFAYGGSVLAFVCVLRAFVVSVTC